MEVKKLKLKVTFTEKLLGSQPGNNTVAADFMRKKAIELGVAVEDLDQETLPEMMDKGTTGFFRDESGKPMLMNYQVMGLIKESAAWLNGIDGVKQLESKIRSTVRVMTRRIPLNGELGEPLERPLRGMTPQGQRVSLARSEVMKPGAWFECEIHLITLPKFAPTVELFRNIMEYGLYLGFGQWRNSHLYGQFEYELTEI